MINIHTASFNEILADLVLVWEKKRPMLLKGILEENQRQGGVINNGGGCALKLQKLMKKSVKINKEILITKGKAKAHSKRRLPVGSLKNAKKG